MLCIRFRQNTIKYYNELAKEAKFSRLRAEWRIKRLKLFHERVALIQQYNKHFEGSDEIDKTIETNVNVTSMIDSISSDLECSFHEDELLEKLDVLRDDDEPKPVISQTNIRDENSNSNLTKTSDHLNILILDEKNQNTRSTEQETTKPSRPTLLDINPNTLNKENLQIFDNLTAAQRNKLKVLEQEFGFTPNNNEFKSLLFDIKNTQLPSYVNTVSPEELTEIQMNRLRNTQTKLSWELVDNEPIIKDITCPTEAQDNRNKIMSHTYHLPSEPILKSHSKTEHITDAQKNRNRIMEPSYESGFECHEAPNRATFLENTNEKPQTALGETPMSTVTDYFTASTQCSTVPMQSYENTPFSETSQRYLVFCDPVKISFNVLLVYSFGFWRTKKKKIIISQFFSLLAMIDSF